MRGKHKQAAHARRSREVNGQIAAAEAELKVEQELLSEAVRSEQRLAQARSRRDESVAARDRLVEAERRRLQTEVDVLRPHLAATEQPAAHTLERVRVLNEHLCDMLGGGVEGLERLGRISNLFQGTVMPDHAGRMTRQRAMQLEIARGNRNAQVTRTDADPPEFGPYRHLAGILHPSLDDVFTAEADGGEPAPPTVVEASRRVHEATWQQVNRDVLHTWYPMPWITDIHHPGFDDNHPIARRLGASANALHGPPSNPVTPGPVTGQPPGPATTAARRDHLSQHDPADLITVWPRMVNPPLPSRVQRRWPTTLDIAPVHQQPEDAVGAHHLYTRAAFGSWIRRHAQHPTDAAAAGTVALGMAAAARYWLPPTQTIDMLDSEPVTDHDDLRLPYPQVFLTFADPPVLPAQPDLVVDSQRTQDDIDILDATALTVRADDHANPPGRLYTWMSAHNYSDREPADVWDVLAAQGARVESLLLLADSLGRLHPTAAWALAVPATTGHSNLTRVLVPTTWQSSAWRNQILNAAAVVAWADWHEPATPLPGDTDHADPNEPVTAADQAVRVLAVRRTRAYQSAENGPTTGRTVAAHVRRGHWRRQHHGPGGQQIKRVRIAPTIVNAGQRGYDNRVYRLPIL